MLAPGRIMLKGEKVHGMSILAPESVAVAGKLSSSQLALFQSILVECRICNSQYPAYSTILRKRAKIVFCNLKTPPNLNYPSSIGDLTKQCLASLDWFLSLTEDKELSHYRFGTLFTHMDSLGAYRDYSYLFTLFPDQCNRAAMWVTSLAASDSLCKCGRWAPRL